MAANEAHSSATPISPALTVIPIQPASLAAADVRENRRRLTRQHGTKPMRLLCQNLCYIAHLKKKQFSR
ncbi:hypothetical protein F01_680004 [Burkholderia cenocepacia]|nr:hypothetical protein F01_680004 [Burkholderia cenocepacia]